MVYNHSMSPRHFSNKYGPYFVGETFRHEKDPVKPKVSILDKIKKLLKLSK